MRVPGLSVFLPCFNESGNLAQLVSRFSAELPAVADAYEIIIVDDGSSDGTGEMADRIASLDSHVRVVHHGVNRGYGAAVRSGISAASQPFVLLCDGDGQFDPAEMKALLEKLNDHDVIVGRRVRRADNLVRRINGKAWTQLVRVLFGVRISDIDCGFKLFRREFLSDLKLHAEGAMITTELMTRLSCRGARICEVDVSHFPRAAGEQSGNSLRVVVRAFRELFVLYHDLKTQI